MTKDLREYSDQTNKRALAFFILILLVVGVGLIWLFYGNLAAISGILCILAGLFPLFLIWLSMKVLDWIIIKADGK